MADTNVFLFYPNLVGYARIILAIVSFESMTYDPVRSALCYFVSALLDAIDGHLARMFNQGSRFGAMLDQLTDRCAFMALLMALCHFYPRWMFWLQMTAVIDIASHWLHLHATDLTRKSSHKSSSNPILNLYYTSRPFLFFMCFGNEAFFGLLYINAFWQGPALFGGVHLMGLIAFVFFPIAFVKTLISLVHLVTASQTVVEHDVELINARKEPNRITNFFVLEMLSVARGSFGCRVVPSLNSVRMETTLAEKMRRAAMGIDQQDSEVIQRERVESELDNKGEPFREAFVKPKRKLNAQLQLERMTGRAELEKFSRFDLVDRLAVRKPRHEEMPTDQDWSSVWPAAASFKASVVPLPVRMGSRPNPDRRPPFKKVGNLELVKIPNFLHLTPDAIKRQCEAIKKFCTPWPKELNEEPSLADKYFPMHISYSDYVHQGTSLRDGRARVCTVTLKLADLKLDDTTRQKFIRLVGNRYDESTDVLTIITDRCPTRKQNLDYAKYLLTVLYRESKKRESWEELAERMDDLKVYFEGSTAQEHLREIVSRSDGFGDLTADNMNDHPKVRKFAEEWYKYRNEKETPESTRSYTESVRELLGIRSLEEKAKNTIALSMNPKTLLVLSTLLVFCGANSVVPCCSAECCCSSCPRETCVTSTRYGQPFPDRRDQCFCANACRKSEVNVRVKFPEAPPPPQQPVQVVVYQDNDDCCAKGKSCGDSAVCGGNVGFCSTCAFSWGYIYGSPILMGICIAIIIVIILIILAGCCLLYSLCFPAAAGGRFQRRRCPSTFEVVHEEETTEYCRGGAQSSQQSETQQRQHRYS